jgi:hypothetical protein
LEKKHKDTIVHMKAVGRYFGIADPERPLLRQSEKQETPLMTLVELVFGKSEELAERTAFMADMLLFETSRAWEGGVVHMNVCIFSMEEKEGSHNSRV